MFCLSNSMEPISWQANIRPATQEIPNIVCNPKLHYCVHKSPPLIPILSQINPVHTTTSYLSKLHFNIVLVFQTVSFLLAFPPKPCIHCSSPPCMLHAMPIESSLVWTFCLYLLKITSYEAQYVIFSSLFLFHPVRLIILSSVISSEPNTVGAWSKAWTAFACSNTEIVRSNPTQGIHVCIVCF
jgi:hypothetical protein